MSDEGELFETSVDSNKAQVYTYVSPEKTWRVASHVIVTPNETLTIDAQLSPIHAKALKEFVLSKGKSKNELIVTHSHPDHFGGLEEMETITSYAFPEVVESIDIEGQGKLNKTRSYVSPEHVASRAVSPDKVLVKEGSFYMDDLEGRIIKIRDAEADVQTIIAFPDLRVIVIQDLVYAGHTFLRRDLSNWIRTLELLTISPYYKVYLIGHGGPVTYEYVRMYVQYLKDAKKLLEEKETYREFKEALVAKYPDFKMEGVLDFVGRDLYPM